MAELDSIRVRARIVLPPTPISLERLAKLQPGGLLRLGAPASATAELVVNGRPLAEGEVVRVGDRRAFCVGVIL